MEKSTSQQPDKRPTTKHCLAIFLSVFTLGAAFLIYFKYPFINTNLSHLFNKPVANAIDAQAVSAVDHEHLTFSPTSNIKGKTFDRFVTLWLENQDYDIAAADR
jgi:hypothetical protein